MNDYRDPERHSFELGPVTENDLMRGGSDAHKLEVVSPTWGDTRWVSASVFRFSRAELVDLRDTIDNYLADTAPVHIGPRC